LDDFFFGDTREFDFGDLALGDLAFFGDSRVFLGDLGLETFAALAFLGEVGNFFGLEGALFGDETFLEIFLVPTFFEGDFVPVPAFFEVEVDLFLVLVVDEEEVEVVPEVDGEEVVEVAFFVDFFFFSLFLSPGASLYEALTLTNNVPSFLWREIFICLLAISGSIL